MGQPFASGYSHIEQKEKLVSEVDSNEFSKTEGQRTKEQALFNFHSFYLLQPCHPPLPSPEDEASDFS